MLYFQTEEEELQAHKKSFIQHQSVLSPMLGVIEVTKITQYSHHLQSFYSLFRKAKDIYEAANVGVFQLDFLG